MAMSTLDLGLTRLLGLGQYLPSLSLENTLLAAPRRSEVRRLAARYRAELDDLAPLVADRDPEAIRSYDDLVLEAIEALRSSHPDGPRGALSLLDQVSLLRRPEYCDDPDCPEEQRRHILACIDWINEGLGSYDLWARWMAADLRPVGGRPTRVLDLAAGHAGFAVALKEQLAGALDITASDLFDEYLALGREQARRRGVQLSFLQQDATDLRNLMDDPFDVIVCTQSIHHFPPGMVARMLGEAARIARRSVWFIDAERSLLAAYLLGLVVALRGRSWPVLHDTVVSLRKMYTEEELSLIGALAPALPPGAQISTHREPPGFASLRVTISP
jgi:2-polyprenyl-3-methyl-5-hydroxy-6-metoxy-1,4-benzoquinol methylase